MCIFLLLCVSCRKYRLYFLVRKKVTNIYFSEKIVNRLFALMPQKKKHPQFSVVSTINRRDRALYRDTVAQQRRYRKNSVILLRHILRKFHKFDYTGTVVYPKSVVLRPEDYGMEIFVYCTLQSHNLQFLVCFL